MAFFFFDSSGLVKRYILETGTAWVQTISDTAAGHDCFLAEITGAEMIAAVTRRRRRGDLTQIDAANALTEINADFLRDFLLIEVSLSRVQEAMVLAERHGLRGYDAVQLACALFLRGQGQLSGQADSVFITADRELMTAARAEGLTVDDPNSH